MKREHAGIVLLCECPRKEELTHTHHEKTGKMIDVEVGNQTIEVPETREVPVKGGVPRITMRPEPDQEDPDTTHFSGACHRCGEVFSGTLTLEEAGLREPAPPAKEVADGNPGDQPE